MKILLVDDENYVIEDLKKKITRLDLSITSIYTSNNIRQAQEIMKMDMVHLIICDIMMPQGTGIEFAEWLRSKKYQSQIVFLTNYAEFKFAQKAIELNSVDYLIKPVSEKKLSETINKAVVNLEKNRVISKYKDQSENLRYGKKILHENFLETIISEPILSKNEINHLVKNNFVTYEWQDTFIPIYIHLYSESLTKEVWNANNTKFVIQNVLRELGKALAFSVELVMPLDTSKYILVIKTQEDFRGPQVELLEMLEKFQVWCQEKLKMDVWLGVDKEINMGDLRSSFKKLVELRNQNLTTWNCVMTNFPKNSGYDNYENPLVATWAKMLQDNQWSETINSMEKYLLKLEKRESVTLEKLKKFRLDVVQLIYAYLSKEKIMAHLLFDTAKSEHAYRLCLEGVRGAKYFARYYLLEAKKHLELVSQPKTVVERIVSYIDNNFQQDIRREEIAKLVYLNEDYLSRLFKQEMGISVSSYIKDCRLTEAKKLLIESNLPINAVAIHVGYTHFAYFTKIFKENTGLAPIEFRRLATKKGL